MKRVLWSSFLILILFLSLYDPVSADDGQVFRKTFEETDQRAFTTTIEIPNLYKVTKVTANNGKVSYSVSGNEVTLKFTNGDHHDERYPTKEIIHNTGPVRSKVFGDTFEYNIGGWHGTLKKLGDFKEESQGYESWSCSVDYGPSLTYPSGTRSCTANGQTVTAYMGSVTTNDSTTVESTDSKYVTAGPTHSSSGSCPTSEGCSAKTTPSSVYYNIDGYTGTLSELDYNYEVTGYLGNGLGGFTWSRTNNGYGGTVTKTIYKPQYSTTFSGSWGRYYDRWSQDYEGTITGPLTKFYYYGVEIEYTTNYYPEISDDFVIPSYINSLAELPYVIKYKVRDLDDDPLRVTLSIGSSSNTVNYEAGTTKSYPPVHYRYERTTSLSNGTYPVKISVYDGKVTVTKELGTINVDRTPPTFSSYLSYSSYSSNQLGPGSIISLRLTPSEEITGPPKVVIHGKQAIVNKKDNYYYSYVVVDDTFADATNFTYQVSNYYDLAGNPGSLMERTVSKQIINQKPEVDLNVRSSSGQAVLTSTGTIYWTAKLKDSTSINKISSISVNSLGSVSSNGSISTSASSLAASKSISSSIVKDYPGRVEFSGILVYSNGQVDKFNDTTDGSYVSLLYDQKKNDIITQPTAPISTPNNFDNYEDPSASVSGYEYVKVYSNNPINREVARPNDTVTLEFKPKKMLKEIPTVRMLGVSRIVEYRDGKYFAEFTNTTSYDRDLTISISSTQDSAGKTVAAVSTTTDSSKVRLLSDVLPSYSVDKLYSDFDPKSPQETTVGYKVYANVTVSDKSYVDLTKLNDVILVNGSSYKSLQFDRLDGNALVFSAEVDTTWLRTGVYTLEEFILLDKYGRKATKGKMTTNSIQVSTFGTPKWDETKLYSTYSDSYYVVGDYVYFKMVPDHPRILSSKDLPQVTFEGDPMELVEFDPGYVIYRIIGGLTATEGSVKIAARGGKDIYGRVLPNYNNAFSLRPEYKDFYREVKISSNNLDPTIANPGDIIYVTLVPHNVKMEAPATITIGGKTVTGVKGEMGTSYSIKVTNDMPQGTVAVSVPKKGNLPALSQSSFNRTVEIVQSGTGWESITLTGSSGDNLKYGDMVTLNATANGIFLTTPTVLINGLEVIPMVSGNSFSAKYPVDLNTPFGQINISITNVKTTTGTQDAFGTTSPNNLVYSDNSEIIKAVAVQNTDRYGNTGGVSTHSKVLVEVAGEIIKPGSVTITSRNTQDDVSGAFSQDSENTVSALLPFSKEVDHRYYVIEIKDMIVKAGGVEKPVSYFGGVTYSRAVRSTPALHYSRGLPYVKILKGGKETSVVYVGDTIDIEIDLKSYGDIDVFPEMVIANEKAENILGFDYDRTNKILKYTRKVTTDMADGWLDLDLSGLSAKNSSTYNTNITPYGYTNVWVAKTKSNPAYHSYIQYISFEGLKSSIFEYSKPLLDSSARGNGKAVVKLKSGYTFRQSSAHIKYLDQTYYFTVDLQDRSIAYLNNPSPSTDYGTLGGVSRIQFVAASDIDIINPSGTQVKIDRNTALGYTEEDRYGLNYAVSPFNVTGSSMTSGTDRIETYTINRTNNITVTGIKYTSKGSKTKVVTNNDYGYGQSTVEITNKSGEASHVTIDGVEFHRTNDPIKAKIFMRMDYVVGHSTDSPTMEMDISIRSNNPINKSLAVNGDKIYLTAKSNAQTIPSGSNAQIAWMSPEKTESLFNGFGFRRTATVVPEAPRGKVALSTGMYQAYDINGGLRTMVPLTETTDGSEVYIVDQLGVLDFIGLSTSGLNSPEVYTGEPITLKFNYKDAKLPTGKAQIRIGNNLIQHTVTRGQNTVSMIANSILVPQGPVTFEISMTVDGQFYTYSTTTDGSYLEYVDYTPITLNKASIKSNNVDPRKAREGDTVTLTLTYSETPSRNPVVILGGKDATVTGTGATRTAVITVDSTIPLGILDIAVDKNPNKNYSGTTVINTTDGTSVEILPLIPLPKLTSMTISSNSDEGIRFAYSGDTITLKLTMDKNVTKAPTATIAGIPATSSVSGKVITYTAIVKDDTPYGRAAISVQANGTDADGMAFGGFTATTDGSYVEIIEPPHEDLELIGITIRSNNANPSLAKAGDVITSTITMNRDDAQFTSVKIGGVLATVVNAGNGIYRATITVPAGLEGYVFTEINNATAFKSDTVVHGTFNTSDGSRVFVDTKAPNVISAVSSIASPKVGDKITISVSFSEALANIPSMTVGGVNVTLTRGTVPTSYTGGFTLTQALFDQGKIPVTISNHRDSAGNVGATWTKTNLFSLIEDVDLGVESVTMKSSTGSNIVKDGDTVTIEVTSLTNIRGVSNAMVMDNSGTVSVSGRKLTLRYVIKSTDDEGPVTFLISDLMDTNGNTIADTITSTTDGSVISISRSAAINLPVSHSSNNPYSPTVVKAGDTITLRVTPSVEVSMLNLTDSNGNLINASTASGNSNVFTFTKMISPMDRNGNLTFAVSSIVVRNITNVTHTFVSPTYVVDTIEPQVLSVVNNGNGTSTISFSENVYDVRVDVDGVVSTLSGSGSSRVINKDLSSITTLTILSARDLPGNRLTDYIVYRDNSGSSDVIMISISGVEDGGTYSGFRIPTYSASSTLSSDVTVSATLNGSNYVSGTPITSTGTYTLRVDAVDSLGNTGHKVYTFVVN